MLQADHATMVRGVRRWLPRRIGLTGRSVGGLADCGRLVGTLSTTTYGSDCPSRSACLTPCAECTVANTTPGVPAGTVLSSAPVPSSTLCFLESSCEGICGKGRYWKLTITLPSLSSPTVTARCTVVVMSRRELKMGGAASSSTSAKSEWYLRPDRFVLWCGMLRLLRCDAMH